MGSKPEGLVEVSVNRHRVTLRVGSLSGLELKQEAAAQGAELQLGFQLWLGRSGRFTTVFDEDLVDVRHGQEFLATTSDDHAFPLPARTTGRSRCPTTGGWSLVLPPRLLIELFRHLLADSGEHAAVILAVHDGARLLGRTFIPAADGLDYVEGSVGYRALSAEFIRDAALRARAERLTYLAVHSRGGAETGGFSHVELASHERGYPALCRITGQPVGALVLTPEAVAGDLWSPDGAREALTEIVVSG